MASSAVLAAALKAPNRHAYFDTLASANIKGAQMGLLPFRMLELSQRLRVEFRLWRTAPDSVKPWIEARIINDAGILGHYVADGANPRTRRFTTTGGRARIRRATPPIADSTAAWNPISSTRKSR